MSFVTDYFDDIGLDYNEVMSAYSRVLPRNMLKYDQTISDLTFTLPSSDIASYGLLQPSDEISVYRIYNGIFGQITEDGLSPSTITTYTLDDNLDEIEEVNLALHGSGYIFDTEDEETEAVLRIAYYDRTYSNIDDEVYTILLQCYYYLYVQDANQFYVALRRLSELKGNKLAENKNKSRSRNINHSRIVPFQL